MCGGWDGAGVGERDLLQPIHGPPGSLQRGQQDNREDHLLTQHLGQNKCFINVTIFNHKNSTDLFFIFCLKHLPMVSLG